MNTIWPIVRLSLLESVRRQVHLITLFLAVLIFLVPGFVGAFNLGTPERVVKDIGMTLIGFYGVGMALFLGSIAIPSEIERKTIYPLLARPLSRLGFLCAKFLSLFILLSVSLMALGLCVVVSLRMFLDHTDFMILVPVLASVVEASVLASACLFFSTFSSPALAAVLGLFIYMVGGLSESFISFFLERQKSEQATAVMAKAFKSLMPHFEFFHIKDAIVHGDPLPGAYVGATLLYGVAWMILFVLLAGFTFERKDV